LGSLRKLFVPGYGPGAVAPPQRSKQGDVSYNKSWDIERYKQEYIFSHKYFNCKFDCVGN